MRVSPTVPYLTFQHLTRNWRSWLGRNPDSRGAAAGNADSREDSVLEFTACSQALDFLNPTN